MLGKRTTSVDDLIDALKPLGRSTSPGPAPVAGFASQRTRRARPIRQPVGPWAVRGCVVLIALLAGVLPQWPYGNSCGWGLGFYSASVAIVLFGGAWGLLLTWNSRLGYTHIIALGTLLWGAALAADIVAPRVGYAAQHATWTCVN